MELLLKQKKEYNYKTFATLNGHNIEKYIAKEIKKQLGVCSIKIDYNKTYDLILCYKKHRYNIEVKSCKRYIQLSNGYQSDGKFKLGYKDIVNNNHIFAFCYYYKRFREIYFVLGKRVRNYIKKKGKKIYYSITIKQLHQYLQPKNKIKDIISCVYTL